MARQDSATIEHSNDTNQGLQTQLADKLIGLFDLVVSDRGNHFAQNPEDIPEKNSVSDIINTYSRNNAMISGGMSLVPGPWGMLAVIPELVMVLRNQLTMIYDIGVAYGKQKVLTKELLAGIFLTAIGAGVSTLLVLNGGRVLVQRVSLRVFQQIVFLLAGKVTQQALKSAISKWLPGVGAAAMAAWSGYLTHQIGKKAEEIFSKEIEVSGALLEGASETIDIVAQTSVETASDDTASSSYNNLNMPKIQTLFNLIKIDGRVQAEEREYIKTILSNANLTSEEKAEIRQTLSEGKKFTVNYSSLLNSPDDAVGLLIDLVTLAKRDGTFHITEKVYIKQVGKLLGFSESDVEETIAAVS